MQNVIMIDYDSEREDSIKITKPEQLIKEISENGLERKMVVDDITTCINALGTLIQIAHDNDIVNKEQSTKMCVDYLNETFINGN
jgi:hypothetical protein